VIFGSVSLDRMSSTSWHDGQMVEATPRFVWGELPSNNNLTTALPFLVKLSVETENKELMTDYQGSVQISALTSKVCLAEGFESKRLGLWYVWQ
jgi:hypothetical protein